MSEKTYTITQPQIAELADLVALADWIKNSLPDECPEKAEAAVKTTRCHAILEAVLYDDAPTIFAPTVTALAKAVGTEQLQVHVHIARIEIRMGGL